MTKTNKKGRSQNEKEKERNLYREITA
jgi:hypothetical protein